MSSISNDEEKPFLSSENEGEHFEDRTATGQSAPQSRHGGQKNFSQARRRALAMRTCLAFALVQLVLLLLNLVVFFLRVPSTTLTSIACNCSGASTVPSFGQKGAGKGADDWGFKEAFSPARSAIRYSVHHLQYDHEPKDSFFGEPSRDIDQNWSRLLRSTMIRISEEEMRRMNKTSVTLKDGSGYVGYLEALHQLHCVKRFYQSQYPERYPELQKQDAFSIGHWNHCLEVLRQGIMCNADVSINTFYWKDNGTRIKGDISGARKCADWGKLQAWMDERTLDYGGDKDQFLQNDLVPHHQPGSVGPVDLLA